MLRTGVLWELGEEGVGSRESDDRYTRFSLFHSALNVATVAFQAVPVVAYFRIIDDAVAATVAVAVRAAVGIRRNGIPRTVVTLLTRIDGAVPAVERCRKATAALVGESGIMCRLLALFPEKLLDGPVPADADLEQARPVASVIVSSVPVIAFLTAVEFPIAANGCRGDERDGR